MLTCRFYVLFFPPSHLVFSFFCLRKLGGLLSKKMFISEQTHESYHFLLVAGYLAFQGSHSFNCEVSMAAMTRHMRTSCRCGQIEKDLPCGSNWTETQQKFASPDSARNWQGIFLPKRQNLHFQNR